MMFTVWRYGGYVRLEILLTGQLISLFCDCMSAVTVVARGDRPAAGPVLFCSFLAVSNLIIHLHNETQSQLHPLCDFK